MRYRRLLVTLVGLTCLRLALTGQHKQYVRVGMGKWLALAGVTLGLLALADLILHRSKDARNNDSATRDRQAAPLAVFPSNVLDGGSASSINEGNTHRDEDAHEPAEQERVPANVHGHEHEHEHEHEHGHDHASTPKIAWLLLLPIAVAFAVVPPALGKWGIDRSSNAAIVATPCVQLSAP